MPADVVLITGTLPKIDEEDAHRIAVYLTLGSEILAAQPAGPGGEIKIPLARQAAETESAYRLALVVGPAGMHNSIGDVPGLQRVAIDSARIRDAEHELTLPLEEIDLSAAILELWWRWCRRYCVSGQVVGANGCPVPFADVTVNTVDFELTETPAVTVTADASGNFTACFNWCGDRCWPCWPFWFLCWPWWWEWDLLYVIDQIENPPVAGPGAALARPMLSQPDASTLARGEGFAGARNSEDRLAPDAARTTLIRRKLSNPAIQRVFPWWWWCCEDPNVCFTVSQGGSVVLDENPATDTRWCLADGSKVTLVATDPVLTACPGAEPPLKGFIWIQVGDTAVDLIHEGYADGLAGTEYSDMAFWDRLAIDGAFAPASNVSYYQVNAAQWPGDPARGGTPPVLLGAPIGAALWNSVVIWHAATNTVDFYNVLMGPFNIGGLSNLYFTPTERASNAASPPGVPPFPAYAAGDLVVWGDPQRVVDTDASNLIGGGVSGAVTLSVTGYDAGFAPQTLQSNPDDTLTLLIDNTAAVTTAQITSLTAYMADGTQVTAVTSSGDQACPAYDIAPGGYVLIDVTVTDDNKHIADYDVYVDYGHGSSGTTTPGDRAYQPPAMFPPAPYEAPDTTTKAFGGGNDQFKFSPPVDCCYLFGLAVAKRVTNGSGSPGSYTADFQTVTLKVSS